MRLTDAGQDLAYLHFILTGGESVGRVFGFVTSSDADLRIPRLFSYAASPVPNLVIELRSSDRILLARTDNRGEFAFDGLAPGDYMLNVFDDYVDNPKPLTEPRRVRVNEEKCIEQSVYVPKVSRR